MGGLLVGGKAAAEIDLGKQSGHRLIGPRPGVLIGRIGGREVGIGDVDVRFQRVEPGVREAAPPIAARREQFPPLAPPASVNCDGSDTTGGE